MSDAVPAPGPAARIQRTAGQVGAVTVALDLVVAFGWFGADGWTPAQSSAVLASAVVLVSAAHNIAGHYRQQAAGQQEVAPIEAAPPSPASANASGAWREVETAKGTAGSEVVVLRDAPKAKPARKPPTKEK